MNKKQIQQEIENFILYYTSNDKERENINKCLYDYMVTFEEEIFSIEQQKQIKECLESCEGAELERTLREITGVE